MGLPRTQNSQTTLKKKNKFGRLILSDCQNYYIPTVIKTIWTRFKHIQTKKINGRQQNPETDLHVGGKPFFLQWHKHNSI